MYVISDYRSFVKVDNAKSAIKFMEEASNQNKPFFQYLPFQHSHHPQFASAEFRGKSKRGAYGDTMLEMDHAIGLVLEFIEKSDKNQRHLCLLRLGWWCAWTLGACSNPW